MKKCITILLTILLFINSGGFIVIYYQVQKSVKQEILSNIREGNLIPDKIEKFRIRKEDLNKTINGFIWSDENEFEYRGRLYDILSIEESDDYFILSVLNDRAEEKIVKSFNDEITQLASGKLNDSRVKTSIVNLISQALVNNVFCLKISFYQYNYFSASAEKILLNDIKIPVPPPKLS